VAVLAGAELLCRVLPVSTATETDYYFDPYILTAPAHHTWTMSTGWDLRNPERLRSNNFGFASTRDFVPDRNAVALIGDSFVEASMLDARDRPGAQLERALGGSRAVYAMGSPGSSLLDYAERIRFAHERFGVRDFVLLMERGDVQQSLCGSGNSHGPCLDEKTFAPRIELHAPAGAAKRLLRHSALAQYLMSQLKIAPQRLWRQAVLQARPAATPLARHAPEATTAAAAMPDMSVAPAIDAVTRRFFARIAPYRAASGRLVVVLDSDRRRIAAGIDPADAERERFMALARAAGAIVVDTRPAFVEQMRHSPLRLEVGPYDGHFNALAVGIIARLAADALDR
jgi:hypothetical protein